MIDNLHTVENEILSGDDKTFQLLNQEKLASIFQIPSLNYQISLPKKWKAKATAGKLKKQKKFEPNLFIDEGVNQFAEVHFYKKNTEYNFQYSVIETSEIDTDEEYKVYLEKNRHVHSTNILLDQFKLGKDFFYFCFDEMEIGFEGIELPPEFQTVEIPKTQTFSLLFFKVIENKILQFKHVHFQEGNEPDFKGMQMMVSILSSLRPIL
jgi:hypothetical protein